MKDIWNIKYDWTLNGDTWLREERLEPYWSGVTYIPDNYFKYKKCLSGVTYQYVNNLDDIYNKNPMVGKNWCIYNMYNEFDIINNFMINMDTVDVCSTSNLDLTQRYYTIDNAYLKTKHKVLLVNQSNNTENGLYVIDQRGYLKVSDFLSKQENSFRYKAYVKLGDNKHKEFHLRNSGDYFPTLYYPSEYMSGKTYIIKNFFGYNLYSKDPIPKLIFTDYDIARHLLPNGYSLYNGLTITNSLSSGDTINIKYHDNDYLIRIDNDTSKFIYTGITSGNTMGYWYDISGSTFYVGPFLDSLPNIEMGFIVKVNSNFVNNSSVGDYLKIEFTGNTSLQYYTNIYFKDVLLPDSLILRDQIPLNILQDFFLSASTYTVTNLQWSTVADIQNTLMDSYQSKYFDVDSSLNINPKYYQYNDYFDYDGFSFIVSGVSFYDTYYFKSQNYYIQYKLYEHLNSINPIFDSSYSFLSNTNISGFTTGFTVLITDVQSSEYYDRYPKGTTIKITPTNPNDVYFFRKNTFVNLNNNYKTLVVDNVPNEYFVVETYKSDSGLTISSIDTIFSLTGISDLLYYVYKNESNEWYRVRDDATRKNICNAYSRIIENDINITKFTTALLTQDNNNKFVLEMYNPESLYNNGGNITVSYDPNLIFKPIELIEIGVDKHTKIPIPILNENLLITYDLLIGSISGSTTGTTLFGMFTFEISTLSGFSYYFQSTYNTTLTIDWGDGNSENITFGTGGFSDNHSYTSDMMCTITIQGDLQYITNIMAYGHITKSNLTNVKNLETLNLANNELNDLDISGLIYLKNLNLYNNKLPDCDKFYNILDSNGNILNGNIDTAGGTNASVTNSSKSSRDNLSLKMWNLSYNSLPSISLPTVITLSVNNISSTHATAYGRVTSNGGSNITAIGFIGSTNSLFTSPIIIPVTITSQTIPINFQKVVNVLAPSTTYYFKSFADNINGRSYGSVLSFTTL